jgi:hypothetical protein
VRFSRTITTTAIFMGDALFITVMGNLSNLGRTIRRLEVEGTFSPGFDWLNQPKWANINIDNLEHLVFKPACAVFGEDWYDLEQTLALEDRSGAALCSILAKCAQAIEVLELDFGCSTTWPAEGAVVELPKLRHLNVGNIRVRPREFASCIGRAKSLASITMNSTFLDSGSHSSEWRLVWDAIRNHENRIELDLTTVQVYNRDFIVRLHSPTPSAVDLDPDAGYEIRSLCDYLSKAGDWNETLTKFFRG